MNGRDRSTDPYEYDDEKLAWFEQFDLRPAPPERIREHLADGRALDTVDLPTHLGKRLIVDADTGLVLYRLVQLFGTPNVPGFEAGANQHDREATTWRYLFELTYAPEDGDVEEYLLSIYDRRTDVSVGLAGWREADGEESLPEPGEESDAVEIPDDEELLVGIVQLALNVVEEPVPATYKDLWV
jgi:hypothetical protein